MNIGNARHRFRFSSPNFGSNPLKHALYALFERLLGLYKLEHIYADLAANVDAAGFISHVLSKLDVSYCVSPEDLKRIPREGPLVVVANHAYGSLDGLILGSVLLSRRKDVKMFANHLLGRVSELTELLLLVDPYAQPNSFQNNLSAMRSALSLLRNGGALGVFPAGDVAHLRLRPPGIHEGAWSTSIARLIQYSNATVVPVYFSGGNGPLFHLLGLVHPKMRTALFPRETINKRGRQIDVHIGKPILASCLKSLGSDERCMRYLRMRSLLLRRRTPALQGAPKPKLFSLAPKVRQEALISPVSHLNLAAEMCRLPKSHILLESGEFSVAYAKAKQIPLILREISRLREQSFRGVGEGTGKACDMDAFDSYYTHLFLWNRERNEVAGAYRFARSDEVLGESGLGQSGFYTATLFNLAPSFFRRLGPTLEMGRSFVRIEYQKNYTPLLLLWKGIAAYVAQFPKYKTLFGPVSISNEYKNLSRQLMASFFERLNTEKELASLVTPRLPFRCSAWVRALMHNMPDDEAELVSVLSDIESDRGLPVLMRQYLKLGGSILGFNVDPHFSNTLDGLVVVNLLKTDRRQLERYMGKEGVKNFFAYHQASC